VGKRLSIALALVPLALAPGLAGAESAARDGGATSQAYALKVIVPGQGGASTTSVAAPTDAVSFGNAGGYGESVSWGASSASASASPGQSVTARASATLSSLILFAGEVQATAIRGAVQARANVESASGDYADSGVGSLTVNGQAMSTAPGARVPLGDWGTAIILAQGASPGEKAYRANVVALDIRLNADHGGLPAGTQILAGFAEAAVTSPIPEPPPTTSTATTTTTTPLPPAAKPPKVPAEPPEQDALPPLVRQPPKGIAPKLTPGGYVFPVYGPASFTNTFSAPRASTGWHHGEDIFAPLGAPLVAVADGTLFSVGWNDVGGYRLWLLDRKGNQFYYAHLSAFSPLAVNGAQVRAGDVLGFMGNSGDAAGTPYHLHFEIHPVSMLHMGYDGVVSPYPYLVRWRRLQDIQFPDGTGWAPAATADATAPKPGAIVLQVSDISTASGLRPGSVARAFVAPVEAEGDGALVRGLASPPLEGGARETQSRTP
jgi:murein DD-endopeptidase MepM/ murein hydrolase activator NlpD